MNDALLIVGRIFKFSGPVFIGDFQQFFYCIVAFLALFFFEARQQFYIQSSLPFKKGHWLKEQMAYAVLLLAILMLGVFDGGQFIYFQF